MTSAVSYTVASSTDAPTSLTYGPSFISLAASYGGEIILGLNRRLNNISNTITAAKLAQSEASNLYAMELGNEPNCKVQIFPHQSPDANSAIPTVYASSDPIAGGASWTAAADYASQVKWQDEVCGNLSATDKISAGVYFGTSPMSIAGLTAVEGSANNYVKSYCSHNYPQSASTANLATLMGHSSIASQISGYSSEITAATNEGKPHIFGETNSGKSIPHQEERMSAENHSSDSRWRWYQPNLWSSSLDS